MRYNEIVLTEVSISVTLCCSACFKTLCYIVKGRLVLIPDSWKRGGSLETDEAIVQTHGEHLKIVPIRLLGVLDQIIFRILVVLNLKAVTCRRNWHYIEVSTSNSQLLVLIIQQIHSVSSVKFSSSFLTIIVSNLHNTDFIFPPKIHLFRKSDFGPIQENFYDIYRSSRLSTYSFKKHFPCESSLLHLVSIQI